MQTTINKTKVLTSLARMMGKRMLPQGVTDDWVEYIQTAFNYSWRYYKWGWSMRMASLDMTNPNLILLPGDFDIDGYIEAVPNSNGDVTYMNHSDFMTVGKYGNAFTVIYDPIQEKYRAIAGSGVSSLDIIYQVAPPELSDLDVPFPSSLTIAIGLS